MFSELHRLAISIKEPEPTDVLSSLSSSVPTLHKPGYVTFIKFHPQITGVLFVSCHCWADIRLSQRQLITARPLISFICSFTSQTYWFPFVIKNAIVDRKHDHKAWRQQKATAQIEPATMGGGLCSLLTTCIALYETERTCAADAWGSFFEMCYYAPPPPPRRRRSPPRRAVSDPFLSIQEALCLPFWPVSLVR